MALRKVLLGFSRRLKGSVSMASKILKGFYSTRIYSKTSELCTVEAVVTARMQEQADFAHGCSITLYRMPLYYSIV